MLKRTREVVQTIAETVGFAPDLPGAQSAADLHRQNLIAAQAASVDATLALQAAHDAGAVDAEIIRLEAALAAANLDMKRAEARYRGAENRLEKADDIEKAKAKAAAVEKRDAALAIRASAAAEIDRLAEQMAEHCKLYDSQLGVLNECARDRVATRDLATPASTLVLNALEKAGALPSSWIGGRAQQPGAVELNKRDAGATLAVRAA